MLPRSLCQAVNSIFFFPQIFVSEVITLKSNQVRLLQHHLTSWVLSSLGEVPKYQELRVSFNQSKQSGLLIPQNHFKPWKSLLNTKIPQMYAQL